MGTAMIMVIMVFAQCAFMHLQRLRVLLTINQPRQTSTN
jgi:hypothetical protein